MVIAAGEASRTIELLSLVPSKSVTGLNENRPKREKPTDAEVVKGRAPAFDANEPVRGTRTRDTKVRAYACAFGGRTLGTAVREARSKVGAYNDMVGWRSHWTGQ